MRLLLLLSLTGCTPDQIDLCTTYINLEDGAICATNVNASTDLDTTEAASIAVFNGDMWADNEILLVSLNHAVQCNEDIPGVCFDGEEVLPSYYISEGADDGPWHICRVSGDISLYGGYFIEMVNLPFEDCIVNE